MLAAATRTSRADTPDPRVATEGKCDQCQQFLVSDTAPCSQSATAGERFGDAIVVFMSDSPWSDTPQVKATHTVSVTAGLSRSDGACIKKAVDELGADCLTACGFVARHVDLPVGAPRSLLGDVRTLIDRWTSYLGSSWALARSWTRWRLGRLLSPGVQIAPNGCLWLPSTTNMVAALRLWERHLGAPLPEAEVRRLRRPEQPIVPAIIAVSAHPRAWRLANGHIFFDDNAIANGTDVEPGAPGWQDYSDGTGIRLCLLPGAS